MKFLLRICAAALALWSTLVSASEVQVAVASNFAAAMQQLATAFTQETGHKAVLSFASTGKFYAQIRNGAPFEILLSADQETPLRLEQEGLALRGSRWTYATGRLVLWSARSDLIDAKGEILRQGRFEHLAIANPALAPYGRAAQEVLTQLGLWSSLQSRLVQGENIGQTYQFVASGNATLGLVALSQVMQDGQLGAGSSWLVPAPLHTPLHQDAVLLKTGQSNPAAAALMDFLHSEKARALMRAHGYTH
ncbi:MAG: molybdate ABC transporter substrate-binding protein [Rhodoferax sp.]